jgi:Holliday junction resolvase RusA-like endonuclease
MAEIPVVRVVLPPYETPRNAWREKIHAAAAASLAAAGVAYSQDDRLRLHVCLHMSESMLWFHDIDNRLKDVLDALQGRAGGPKSVRRLAALIPNDRQVYRAVIEKVTAPAGDESGGWLTIAGTAPIAGSAV